MLHSRFITRLLCGFSCGVFTFVATQGSVAKAQGITFQPFPKVRPVCPGHGVPQPLPLPVPQPIPLPSPAPPSPAPQPYFLGVKVKTVAVDSSSPIVTTGASDIRVQVAPGYGEQVYGQMVLSVAPNSPAFHAGLEPGDVIVDANGIAMDTGHQLSHAVQYSQGRLEMKVLDVRTNNLVWVVALLYGPDEVITETPLPVITQRPASQLPAQTAHLRATGSAALASQRNSHSQSLQGQRRPPVRRQVQ